jgi:hypothetical protein
VSTSNPRRRLANRRSAETLGLECAGLAYTRTVTYFADGRLAEVFLGNRKNNSGTDVVGRDSAIVLSIPLQHGADPDVIRRALCRDSQCRASGPLGVSLDIIAERESQ